MPAPYSDNLYSADDSDLDVTDDDLDAHLSPTDGYFYGTSSSAANLYPPQREEQENHNVTDATPRPTSAGVPYVPNILVQDPSLQQQQGDSKKDREAREETSLLNSSALSLQETSSPSAASAPAATAAQYQHHYDDDGASTSGDIEPTQSHTTYTSYAHGSSSYTPYSPSVDAPLRTPQTHSRRSPYSHSPSLFSIPREAPPAYTPSPTSPLSSSPTAHWNYQTVSSTMGVPEEGRRLLGRDPESMGDEPYHNDPRPPRRLRDRVLKKFPWATRRTLKTVLLAALVLAALSAFLGILAKNVFRAPSDPSPAQPGFEPGLPIKDGPKAPVDPSQPAQPPSQPGQPSRLLPWNPQSSCDRTEHRFETRVFDLSFKPDKTISVLQSVNTDVPHRGYQPQVSGSFVVRRQLSHAPGPSIEVEVVGNDERLAVDVEWDSGSQQLKIKTPQYVEWNQALRPCMAVRATVWVPENAELEILQLAALNLDVQLRDDLALTVTDGIEIRTYSGDVSSPAQPPASYKLDSRNIVVQTISGDVAGTWPLYDSLKVGSDSGDISVSVEPQPVLESKPLPAVLNIATISGDITVREPLSKAIKTSKPGTVIPPRDYVTDIDTKSGTVRAWVTFSSVAALTTISGDISGAILPVYNVSLSQGVPEPELHTETKSGAVTLAILEPMWVEIASTLSRGGEKTTPPTADPNRPVDIPTNPVPVPVPAVPAVPIKMPRMHNLPSVPFMPIDAREPGTQLSSDVAVPEQQQQQQARAGSSLPMRHLKSSHTSISGDLKLSYPGSWEGTIEAESISGNINIGGDGVRIESRTQWPKTVRAVKGERYACSASVSTASGNTNLHVGR